VTLVTQQRLYANDPNIGANNPMYVNTQYTYDALGRQTEIVEALDDWTQRTTVQVFDGGDSLRQVTSGIATDSTYQHLTVTAYDYDALGRRTKVIEAPNTWWQRTTVTVYNALDQVVAVQKPLRNDLPPPASGLNGISGTLDLLGWIATPPFTTTRNRYDILGRLVQVTEAQGAPEQRLTITAYDAANHITTVMQSLTPADPRLGGPASSPAFVVSSYTYDGLGRQIMMIEALNTAVQRTTLHGYDAADNLISQVTGASPDPSYAHLLTTVYKYDYLNRRISITEAAFTDQARTTSEIYDALDNVITITQQRLHDGDPAIDPFYDPQYVTTLIWYDTFGHQRRIVEADSTSAARTMTQTFNAAGNLIGSVNWVGTETDTAYDGLGRPTKVIEAVGTSLQRTTSTTYDSADNVTALAKPRLYDNDPAADPVKNPAQTITQYVFDVLNRQVAMTEAAGTVWARTTLSGYDAADNLVWVTSGLTINNASYSDPAVVNNYAHPATTSYGYDQLHHRIRMTEAVGLAGQQRTTTYKYDSLDNLAEVDQPITFDIGTQVPNQAPPQAAFDVTLYGYDALNRQTTIVEAASTSIQRTTTKAYDAAGNLITVVQQRLVVDMLDPVHNPQFVTTRYYYDTLNRQIRMTEAVGTDVQRTTAMLYDAASNLRELSKPLHYDTDYNGNLLDGPFLAAQTAYAYDALNRQTTVIEGVGVPQLQRTTRMTYDAAGHQVSVTKPLTYDNNSDGTPDAFQVTVTTRFYFDALGRRSKVVQAYGVAGLQRSIISWYDAAGNLTSVQAPNQTTASYTYDALNRQIKAKDANGNATSASYDAADNKIVSIDGRGDGTSQAFNALNQTIYVKAADTGITRYYYDAANHVLQQTDANGLVTKYLYDTLGRRIVVQNAGLQYDPQVYITVTHYDAAGDIDAVRDPDGNNTFYEFDALGRQIQITDPYNNVTQTQYDPGDHVVFSVDRDGRQFGSAYDPLGRLVMQVWSVPNPANPTVLLQTDVRTFVYDAADDRTSASNAMGVYSFEFDVLQRVTTQVDPNGIELSYHYDSMDNCTAVYDSRGGSVTSTFDPVGNVATRSLGTSAGWLTVALSYTGTNQIQTLTRYVGDPQLTSPVGRTTVAYDPVGRTALLQHANQQQPATLTVFATYTTQYDQGGRPTLDTSTYAADAYSKSYSYLWTPPTPFQLLNAPVVQPANRVVDDGTWLYWYDNEGNIAWKASKTTLSTPEIWRYEYDQEHRLTVAHRYLLATVDDWALWNSQAASSLAGRIGRIFGNVARGTMLNPNKLIEIQRISYGYDALGDRIVVQLLQAAVQDSPYYWVNVTLSENGYTDHGNYLPGRPIDTGTLTINRYAYNGTTLWADLDSNGNVQARYLFGASGPPLAKLAANGTIVWYYSDRFGTVRQLADATGQVVTYYKYDQQSRVSYKGGNLNLVDRWEANGREADPVSQIHYQPGLSQDLDSGHQLGADPRWLALGEYNPNRNYGQGPDSTGSDEFYNPLKDAMIGLNADFMRGVADNPTNAVNQFYYLNTIAANAAQLRDGALESGGRALTWLNDTVRRNGDQTVAVLRGDRAALQNTADNAWVFAGLPDIIGAEGRRMNREATGFDSTQSFLVNAHAGLIDTLSMGLTQKFRRWMGDLSGRGDDTSYNSAGYAAGTLAGQAVEIGIDIGLQFLPGGGQALTAVRWGLRAYRSFQVAMSVVNAVEALDRGQFVHAGLSALGAASSAFHINSGLYAVCSASPAFQVLYKGLNAVQVAGAVYGVAEEAAEGNPLLALGRGALMAFSHGWQMLRACFAAGTPVLTREGSRGIETLKPGDRILSRNEFDVEGIVEEKVVEEVFVRTAQLFHVHVGGQVIRTTVEHPFYVAGRGWVPAIELQPGDLLSSHDGQWVPVEEVFDTGEFETVYNVRVADYHTYFVGSEEWGFSVWAHNSYQGDSDAAELSRAARRRDGGDLTAQVPARRAIIENVFGEIEAATGGEPLMEKLGLNSERHLNMDAPSDATGANRSHIIYTLTDKATGEIVYVGRASELGTPTQALNARLNKPHEYYDPALHDVQVREVLPSKYSVQGAEEVYLVGLREQGANLINSPRDWGVGYDNAARAGKSLDRLQAFADVVNARRAGN
jgi:YD repeat-containing protein